VDSRRRRIQKKFLIELHKYLKSKLPHNKVDEYPRACIFDHFNESEYYRYKHFSDFCKLQRVDPYVAHRLLLIQHGDLYCDCDYLHNMKITEDSDKTQTLERVHNRIERR
jgi:hypothetical protein